MKKGIVAAFAALSFAGIARAEDDQFMRYAIARVDQIDQALVACGLQVMDPFDPRLPRPQIDVDRAVATADFRLLAYYNMRNVGFNTTEFAYKNPNGGMVHKIEVTYDRIIFQTPYKGIVARSNRMEVVTGYRYHYYCYQNYYVSPDQFEACVQADFVQVVAGQLCRFAN